MAFVAHLDFQQLWWRLLRLADIQLEFSRGYNPRPKMRFATPLATGFEGEQELLEIFCRRQEPNMAERLNAILPQGLKVLAVTAVPPGFPKLTALVAALAYRIELPAPLADADCLYEQAGDYLLAFELRQSELRLLLKVEQQRTVRPDTLAAGCCAGYEPASFPVTRSGIYARPSEAISPQPAGLLFLEPCQ